jgi:L-lactate dehydrogenase complex protein LldG
LAVIVPTDPSSQTAADLLAAFTVEAERAAAVVHNCYGLEAVAKLALALTGEGGRICMSVTAADRFPDLLARLAETVPVSQPATPAEAALATVGVSTAEALVPETGSLLLAEHSLADRLVSMLSPVLIEIVPASAILPTLDDVGAVLSEWLRGGRPGYNTLMTGPSRSADIERSMTIGVQGPNEVHVAILHPAPAEISP